MKMNKKGATSLATLILVVATLVLIGFSLFTFLIRDKSIEKKAVISIGEQQVYVVEKEVNFYLSHGGSLGEVPGLFGVKVDDNFFVAEISDNEGNVFNYKFEIKKS